jgi:hypothetical protein
VFGPSACKLGETMKSRASSVQMICRAASCLDQKTAIGVVDERNRSARYETDVILTYFTSEGITQARGSLGAFLRVSINNRL